VSENERLNRENLIELAVVQSLVRAISTNVRAVSLEFPGDDVRAYSLSTLGDRG
jgi:hypothetical protein